MEALQNRIESFAKSKRVKGSKSSRSVPKWPHPQTFKANPESLAEAGFYFNPSPEDKDNVSCFECGKQLSEWEEDDDPFDLHWTKCGDKCSWAAVRCGLRGDMDRHGKFTFPDKSRLPESKRMEKARLGTFNVGDGWIHDQTKGHSANSRKMAQAGFAWTPQVPGDDLTTCLYCNISLSGWEEEDDPMEEHRKRAKSCPFLKHSSGSGSSSASQTTTASPTANKLTRSTSAKPPSKVDAKPPSRSRSSRQTRGHKELVMMTKDRGLEEEEENGVQRIPEEIEDEISDIPTVRLVQKPAEAQRTRKSSRAPSARPSTRGATRAASQPVPDTDYMKGKSQGRSRTLKNVREEESPDEICILEEEEIGQQPAPSRPRALRKPTKARAKSTSRRKQEEVITQDESEDLGASNRRTLKSRKNQVVEETDAEDEDIQPVGRNVSEREEEEVVLAASQSRAPKKVVGKSSSQSKKDERSHEVVGTKGRRRTTKHVEKEESGTDATREEENTTNYGMSEQEEEEERSAPSRSRSTTKASKRSSRAPSANASRRKKGANGARQRGPERAKEETLDEDDSNRDDISPPVQDQSEPGKEDLTPAPSRSRALRKSVKARDASSRKENKVSSADELQSLIPKHRNQKNRVTSSDGDEETVHFPKLGNEERTPVQRPRVPISEKFKPVRSPRKEAQGPDSVKHAVEVVETMFKKDDKSNRAIRRISDEDLLTSKVQVEPKKKTTIQKTTPSLVAVETITEMDIDKSDQVTRRISHEDLAPSKMQAEDATIPPTELLALNFENTPMVEERTAVIPVSPSLSSVPTVNSPSSSPALPAMTVEATTPEPQIPPAMTAEATTPEPQVLSALPTMTANATTAEPQTFPALSRIPFMPLQTLTDAELDMTVEEWIRYQMEIEYDKLKRDGERELARFKARAEEARRIIECL